MYSISRIFIITYAYYYEYDFFQIFENLCTFFQKKVIQNERTPIILTIPLDMYIYFPSGVVFIPIKIMQYFLFNFMEKYLSSILLLTGS